MRIGLFIPPVVRFENGVYKKSLMDKELSSPPLGAYIIYEVLLAKYDVECVNLQLQNEITDVLLKSILTKYQVVLVSFNSLNYFLAKRISILAKEINSSVIVIGGGPHPTLYPKQTIADTEFDYLIRGNGEELILSLIESISKKKKIPKGITFGDTISEINNSATFHVPPIISWHKHSEIHQYASLPLETSRGCMSVCRFCSITSKGKWTNLHYSAIEKNVISISKVSSKPISIVDDCLTTDQGHVERIADILTRNTKNQKITFNTRAADVLSKTYDLKSIKNHTGKMLLGAECGYDEGLNTINKKITSSDLIFSAKKIAKFDLSENTIYSFIIGFPWEGMDEIRKTILFSYRLIIEYGISVYLQWYIPVPGSPIFKETNIDINNLSECNYLYSNDMLFSHRKISVDDHRRIDDLVSNIRLLLSIKKHETNLEYTSMIALSRAYSGAD